MKKLLMLSLIFAIQGSSIAADFGTTGAENIRTQRELEYQEMKKDMQNFRSTQIKQQQFQQSNVPNIQRNSGGGDNYNFSNATNQYTGTMVVPIR